ncbi:MBOAT family protein [Larkinella knui]|uniref:MBOAT family protein n=1 Tax=Larkinella knui TaxID=2025310 RepID=A0A3P1CDF6_9BACT|nr:MBOAT family O-acyltransferase [Larkinella knui]RRB11327.1 MBOAT family protein [Larkinella knui]
MLFNSLQFLLFFIVVTLAYYSLPWRGRWVLLLLASCYFYMVFKPTYILILFLTIVIDYYAGIWLERTKPGSSRKWLLIISLISNIGILAFFKYFGFFTDSVVWLLDQLNLDGPAQLVNRKAISLLNKVLTLFGQPNTTSFSIVDSILPIGLSFHTFQAMSYTIEVYRGNQKAERHFGIYALYVMFYPQLVAGPIERPQNVLHQFHTHFHFSFENLKAGLMQMAFGFFKKVVIADRMAELVSHAYNNPTQQNGLTLLVATLAFTIQIYCDFSGYSDIAIGAARTMGFTLMENFKTPYFSRSITEFWRRWHISLSTWFRDYLYIPLGGNRVSPSRRYLNVFIVFLVSGLWHGASWNYIIWGGLHGAYQLLAGWRDKAFNQLGIKLPEENKAYQLLQLILTFVLVMLTWVFFRNHKAPVGNAFHILGKIVFSPFDGPLSTPFNATELWFCVALVAVLFLKEKFYLTIPTRNTGLFFVLFPLICFLSYLFGVFTSNQFIYFQF